MASKPTPGGSESNWGTELNEYLSVFLNTDGVPKFAWGYVSEAGGVHTLENSIHVDSISDVSTGIVRVNLSTDFELERGSFCVVGNVIGTGNRILSYATVSGVRRDPNYVKIYTANTSNTLSSEPFSFFIMIVEDDR